MTSKFIRTSMKADSIDTKNVLLMVTLVKNVGVGQIYVCLELYNDLPLVSYTMTMTYLPLVNYTMIYH